jgi:hypothetical protein
MHVTKAISRSYSDNTKVRNQDHMFLTLILVALAVDTITPYLIWKEAIPSSIRWLSHAVVAAMILVAYARVMLFDRVPGLLWLILGISVIGGAVAYSNNQGLSATLWGWWIMFQYPFVGLFAYMQPSWPKDFPRIVRNVLVGILVLTVIVQGIQYWQGATPGDSLAGIFAEHGTGKLVIFILLAFCFALGGWMVKGRWQFLIFVAGVGAISSLLGEIKLFPFAALGIGALSIALIRGKQIMKLVLNSVLILGVAGLFLIAYNAFVPAAENRPLEKFLEFEVLDQYFGFAKQQSTGGQNLYSNVGRNYAIQQIWNDITEDAKTFFLGMGLGARGESQALGIVGIGFSRTALDFTSGTSLLVMMQEFGILGFVSVGGFFFWLILRLFKDIRSNPESELTILRYGLLLFSTLWPVWLWYGSVWSFRVPMLIYWVVLGYVLSHSDGTGQPVVPLNEIESWK